jgi:hypothetical protein
MLRRRFLLLGLPLVLAALVLVPVLADAPKDPTGNAPFELLVHRFRAPTGIAVAHDGTVFFTERKEGRLWQRAPTGRRTTLLDRLEHPQGLLRGEDGTLYLVADGFRASKKESGQKGVLLKRHRDEGTVTVLAEEFKTPQQLAFDKDGHLFLSTTGGRHHPPEREEDDERDHEDDDEDAEADDDEEEDAEPLPEGFRGTVFRIHSETGDVLAAHAGFRRPSGVVSDEAGILTVAAERFRDGESRLKGTLFQINANGDVRVLLEERFWRPKGLVRDVLGSFYLAVKRDPEHPKDGGLILKVAPDGSFTRFAQGFERPWGLTFDPQGNLYVTDPRAGTISRFLAPAAPALSPLPETTTQSSIEVSGTAEPASKITVLGGPETVTTLADLEGKFSLDVPLLPDQVNGLKVYATGAQGEGLTSAPASATIQQQTTPAPPSVTIVLQITDPSPGATITAASVLVRGLVDAGGREVGVTVNGFAALLSGTQWAVEVPLVPGSNTVSATATTVTGVHATTSLTVNVPQPTPQQLLLRAGPASGVEPLEVTWEVINQTGRPLIQFALDETGTGAFGPPTGTFDGVKTTYAIPGLKFPTLLATDDQGTTYRASTVVNVLDRAALDATLQGRWTAIKSALSAGNAAAAISHIVSDSRDAYAVVFNALGSELSLLGADMPAIQPVYFDEDFAKYRLRRQQRVGGTIMTITHYIYFGVDTDGIWRLHSF